MENGCEAEALFRLHRMLTMPPGLLTPPSEFAALDEEARCADCARPERLSFRFSFAYQPIVDVRSREVFAHEALVRGPAGESALSVLSQVNDDNRYRFDQACRTKAIKTAAELGMPSRLSINFLPNAIYRPELCIRATLHAARAHAFPIERIIFETVEGEQVDDGKWLAKVLREYQRIGFLTAIDDFGAGYAGLNLLADFQPDLVKLDMGLVRHIDTQRPRQAIVRHIAGLCSELGIQVIAEGVETADECRCLMDLGVHLLQGYHFSKPKFEAFVHPDALSWPD